MGLEHEADHALRYNKDPRWIDQDRGSPDERFDNAEERRVILGSESLTAGLIGEPMRFNHTYRITCRTAGVSGSRCI
jgi:hypothetical protein